MATIAYKKTSITGGTVNSLDGIDGATLNVGDFGFVFAADDAQYDYEVRESGATPDGLNIVIPVINPGDMRWHIKLRTADSLANVALTHADVLLTNADVVSTNADVVSTNADAAQTALDVIATAADRVQTGLDAVATAADRVQTGLDAAATAQDAIDTAADVVSTGLDVIAAAAQAAALIGTSTTSLLIEVAEKTFTTQASKQFSAGMFVLAVSDANPANYMHGQVTSYSGTTLVVNVIDIGGSGTLADWTISVSGSRGAKGDTGTGITEEAVGWTGTGGTTPKTLTVAETMTLTGYSSAAEIITGTEAAKAIAPDQLAIALFHTKGAIPYASDVNVPASLAAGAANLKLFMNAAGTAPEWAVGYIQVNYTRDISLTSAWTLTGAGFTPSGFIAIGGIQAGHIFVGMTDGTTSFSWTMYSAVTNIYHDTTCPINAWVSGSAYQQYSFSAWTSDGVTLTCNKTGSPTGTLNLSVFYRR